MDTTRHGPAARWIRAAKPASWPKLLVPALLGQALGVAAVGRLDLVAFGFGMAFTALDLLYVVFLNDWGDREVDRVKRKLFPATSPKTIPDGLLGPGEVLIAGLLAGLAAMVLAFVSAHALGRPGLGLFGVACLGFLVAYTLPPVKLNYRGGGELLEMLGVGIALPWFNLYLQSGELSSKGMWVLPGFALLCLASAVASGLSDEVSDRAGGKTTYATENGNPAARKLVERVLALGTLVLVVGLRFAGVVPAPLAAIAVAAIVINLYRLRKIGPLAETNAFTSLTRYKDALHNAIWRSGTLLALFIVLVALWGSRS